MADLVTSISDAVVLSWDEAFLAAIVGVRRQLRSMLNGRRDAHGFRGDPWQAHIGGAIGELAVAKCLDRYWTGSGELFGNDTDVAGYQVRTRTEHFHDLYVWENDPDDAIYVLVTGQVPTVLVRGWILAQDAKCPEWWREANGTFPRESCFVVPASALNRMEDLRL